MKEMWMKTLMLALALLLFVVTPALAVSRVQVTCTAPAAGTGDAPTEYRIEREANASNVWTQVAVLPASGPLVLVDRTAVNGTPYRFRCMAVNATGVGVASGPSVSVTLVATARVPGQAGVEVIIIQEQDPVATPKATPKAPVKK
jgi:hypothetical protein